MKELKFKRGKERKRYEKEIMLMDPNKSAIAVNSDLDSFATGRNLGISKQKKQS